MVNILRRMGDKKDLSMHILMPKQPSRMERNRVNHLDKYAVLIL